jgi:disulfide bond formation protein DsbB
MPMTRKNQLLYAAWLIAIVSTLGSLYYSDVMHLTPCVLCWYQRIFMYPLVLVIPIGIIKKDKILPWYVVVLSSIGGLIALYHYLLQRGIIPDRLAPCQAGVSCTTKLIEYYGFITIPFLTLVAFALITTAMFLILREKK